MKNYINVKFFLVRNIKTRTNWFNPRHQDSITKSRTALAKSRQLECLEIYQQNFHKTTSKKSIFKIGDSESISKILEKHLQRNLHFRKLFCICEQIHPWRNSFFQFIILLVILVIVCNAPLLKCLASVSVNHLLETL